MPYWDELPYSQPEWLLQMHDIFKTQRAFIVGSGPSLHQQVDTLPALSDGRELVFTCNKLPQWKECPFVPKFHCITEPNHLVHRGRHECPEWEAQGTIKLAMHWSTEYLGHVVEKNNWKWVAKAPDDIQVRKDGFQGLDDFLPPLPTGYTSPLSVAQLAAWMGCPEIIFLGIDMTDEGYVFNATQQRGISPKTLNGIRECFIRARRDIEETGRKVYDCTPGGLLNMERILEYAPLEEVL